MLTLMMPPTEVAVPKMAALVTIGAQMLKAELPQQFVVGAILTALQLEGVCELMTMWPESDPEEQGEIVADIQELMDDSHQVGVTVSPVRFDDLDQIANDVMGFKNSLRLLVETRGGIGQLAGLIGMPQPSLSRFFSTPALPRRITLLKIAKALDLSEVQISNKWSY